MLLASAKNIDVHNSIMEYASTVNNSTTPPFHIHSVAISWEIKFEKVFSSNIFKNSWASSNNETEQRKRKMRKFESKKKKRERKAPKVSHEEKGFKFLERRKTISNFIRFCVSPFSLFPPFHFKPFLIDFEKFHGLV